MHREQQAQQPERRQDPGEPAAVIFPERRDSRQEDQGTGVHRDEVRARAGRFSEPRRGPCGRRREGPEVTRLDRQRMAAVGSDHELRHRQERPRRQREPEGKSRPEAPHRNGARQRHDRIRELASRRQRERNRQRYRRERHLRAPRHRLQTDQRGETQHGRPGPEPGSRNRGDRRQVREGSEVVPVGRKRRREAARREGRGAEEAPRIRDVLLLQEPSGAPDRDGEVQQEIEPGREGRRRNQEEQIRRIEDAGLAVRQPRLTRSGERIPQGDLAGAHPVGRVELERIEEVSLVTKRRSPVRKERRPEPEDGGEERRAHGDPGHDPAAQHGLF